MSVKLVSDTSKERTPQAVRSAKMQRRLSKAAFSIIRDVGYVNFRTSAVAKHAGVSQGAQLHHYPNKDSLAIAALEYAYSESYKRFATNFAQARHTDDLLGLMLKDFEDFYLSDYFMVALDIIMAGGKNDNLRKPIIKITLDNRKKIERMWLEELINDGWGLAAAEQVLALSHSIIRGFAARGLVVEDRSEFEQLKQRWREMAEQFFKHNDPRQS